MKNNSQLNTFLLAGLLGVSGWTCKTVVDLTSTVAVLVNRVATMEKVLNR